VTAPAPLEAVLLDMDGTLVDSDAAVERAWLRWAETAGVDPSVLLPRVHGYATRQTVRRFAPHLTDSEVEAAAALVLEAESFDVSDVVLAPGGGVLLERLAAARIPWAVVTNAPRRLAAARLDAVGVRPPLVITTDDVRAGKPAPDGFLLAAARLGVPIERCLVVEDSLPGVEAGRRAGATVAGLRGVPADLPVADLAEVAALVADDEPVASFCFH
jgi:HAD superfamily hydrolase (TIGR01509 family)